MSLHRRRLERDELTGEEWVALDAYLDRVGQPEDADLYEYLRGGHGDDPIVLFEEARCARMSGHVDDCVCARISSSWVCSVRDW